MPTYAFACPACGPFDKVTRIADRDAPTTCPRCGAPAQRLTSAPRIGLARSTAMNDSQSGGGNYARLRHAAGCACCP